MPARRNAAGHATAREIVAGVAEGWLDSRTWEQPLKREFPKSWLIVVTKRLESGISD